ncbi:MAG: thymidine phosphorylase, partial [Patescibacteria group bacterium]
KIPKNSSRAITSPSGTADTMEVIAPVTFSPKQIQRIVEKVGGCIVWGGHLGLAPADDILIQVEEPLAFESFDKIIISVMAKKVASGATHVVFDIPVGPNMKIKYMKDALIIEKKFKFLAKKFGITIATDVNETREPAGRGVGPVLEVRDVFQVLEQRKDRPLMLEQKALRLAAKLLELCFMSMPGKSSQSGEKVAHELLASGKALKKMREIIKIQGGDPNCSCDHLVLAKSKHELRSELKGRVTELNNKDISVIARILGSPHDKKAGIYLERKLEDEIDKDDILCTLYSSDKWRLQEAVETLKHVPIYKVE